MELCTLEKHGFRGHYFEGTTNADKTIIAVGGASCTEKACVAMSQYLVDAGYNVLVLGFICGKGCLAASQIYRLTIARRRLSG